MGIFKGAERCRYQVPYRLARQRHAALVPVAPCADGVRKRVSCAMFECTSFERGTSRGTRTAGSPIGQTLPCSGVEDSTEFRVTSIIQAGQRERASQRVSTPVRLRGPRGSNSGHPPVRDVAFAVRANNTVLAFSVNRTTVAVTATNIEQSTGFTPGRQWTADRTTMMTSMSQTPSWEWTVQYGSEPPSWYL
ncbi:hypothetical protein QF002_001354 [Paraburkholderia youngii]